MTTEQTVQVRRNEETHRFEAHLDGAVAGFIDYRQHGEQLLLIHTETDPDFEGQGVGSALARFALDEIRVRGEKAIVLCPFLKAWLGRHPGEYDDIAELRD